MNDQVRIPSNRHMLAVIIICGAISGCGQPAIPTPTPTQTLTSTITLTPQPSATSTPVLSPTPSLTPTPFGGAAKITFSSNRDGNFDIYVMNPDGSSISQLTFSETDNYFPEFSPDGDLMYWDVNLDSIKIIKSDGQELIFFGCTGRSSWSPDGQELALVLPSGAGDFGINRFSLGRGVILLTTGPWNDQEPAWSPDGETIAFTSDRDGAPHIYLMGALYGSNQRRLTSGNMVEFEPDWSPDGEMLAFVSGDNTNFQIYIVNSDGSNLLQLTDSQGFNENPAWSPDGTLLAFWSDRTGNKEIYVLGVDGEGLIQITNNPADDINPFWVQD